MSGSNGIYRGFTGAVQYRMKRNQWDLSQVTPQVTQQVGFLQSRPEGEMTRQAIQGALALADREHFRTAYLAPALAQGLVEMTLPDKPNSRSQRYRLTALGQNWVERQSGAGQRRGGWRAGAVIG